MEETIVAQATPGGRGGIAVVRLSGEGAKAVGKMICGSLPEAWSLKPCSFSRCGGEVIDSGLVIFFAGPRSYTGEDVVELHCHGNPLIVDALVSSAVSFGARVAEPGEFTKRAFLNNKIDLAQAEAVSDLISAKTEASLRGANASLSGDFSKAINTSIDRLIKLRVSVEARLDFPDEDDVGGGLENVNKDLLSGIEREVSFMGSLLSSSRSSQVLRKGAKVVIVGPPNCGKSTLLNFFASDDVAITSNSPGTTRDVVRASVDFGGVPVELVDTAGIRFGGVGLVEGEGIRRASEETKGADLVLIMSVVGEDFSFELDGGVSFLRVYNKVDLCDLGGSEFVGDGVFVSALTGYGIDVLVEKVCSEMGVGLGVETPFLVRRRHLSFLGSAKEGLVRAVGVLESGGGFEVAAEELRAAQFALGQITRPLSSDGLLGEIFSSFCIGK